MTVTNSYKLNLAINDSKTTKNDNRDTNQHRNYIEDLVNLLFCLDSEDFSQKITEKSYPKYQSQPHQAGRKASSNAINRVENSNNQQFDTTNIPEPLYEHHTHFKSSKKGNCAFCIPKSTNSLRDQNLGQKDFSISVFRLNSIESSQNTDTEKSKRDRKREKQTF